MFVYNWLARRASYKGLESNQVTSVLIQKLNKSNKLLMINMIRIIKTSSFELAVYMKGSRNCKKLALVLPGRLDTKDYKHMRSHVDFLANNGYLAISFDPPGTWESQGDIKRYTMTNYLKAINELIECLDNKPTVLMGHSIGGTMAMLAGTRNIHVTHIICAMSHPTPSRLSPKTKDTGFQIQYRDTPTGGKKKFLLPLSFFKDAAKYNMINALSKCTKPKLYILGKKDDIVAPSVVRNIYKKSAKPKQLIEINSDHDYRRHPKIIEAINVKIGQFLQKYPR